MSCPMIKSSARPFLSGSVLLALLLAAFPALPAEEPAGRFIERKAEGWFWYKDPKEEKKKAPEPEQPVVAQAGKKDEPFSVEWLRKNMPVLLSRAIDNPTKDNVAAYLYAQRVAMDKSQIFSEVAQKVVYADPFLDENNRVPLSTFAKPFFLRSLGGAGEEALKHLAGVGGIWMFFDSTCEFCKTQATTIEEMRKRYGFFVKYISTDGKGLPNLPEWVKDNGHAAMLNLRVTPTTVFVVPPNNYYIVSQGMMAQDQLAERVLVAAESNKLLPKPLLAKLNLYERGVLKPEDTSRGAGDDPAEWVNYLKERLKGRY